MKQQGKSKLAVLWIILLGSIAAIVYTVMRAP